MKVNKNAWEKPTLCLKNICEKPRKRTISARKMTCKSNKSDCIMPWIYYESARIMPRKCLGKDYKDRKVREESLGQPSLMSSDDNPPSKSINIASRMPRGEM